MNDNRASPIDPGPWDVAVVGAGIAGGVAANLLARQGRRVLLIERYRFPRSKICGCCLNASAVAQFRAVGLGGALAGGAPTHRLAIHMNRRHLGIPLEPGWTIARATLDAALVEAACTNGAVFSDGTSASLLGELDANGRRVIELRQGERQSRITADIVLACDGIHGGLLASMPQMDWQIASGAWFGWSVALPRDIGWVEAGTIHMLLGDGGYVGLVRMAEGAVHIASAMDPKASRQAGGPMQLARAIVHQAGLDWPTGAADAKPLGTGLLTRRRTQIGEHRVLAVGDACGYVEPFTGEGMAWAVSGACQAVNLLPPPGEPWPDDALARWTACHRAAIWSRQHWCQAIRYLAHRPRLARTTLALASIHLGLVGHVARRIARSGLTHAAASGVPT